MKKSAGICTLLCALLCAAVMLLIVPSFAVLAEEQGSYVYFYNSLGWGDVYAYCYDSTNSAVGDTFPGTQLSSDEATGENWYKYELPAVEEGTTIRVIFSNATDTDKIDVKITDDGLIYYNAYRSYGFASAEEATSAENNCEEVIEATGTTRVYYYNSLRWKTVYAYAYSTDEKTQYLKAWPGTIASADSERENWYYIDVNQNCEEVNFYIIFNNQSSGSSNQSTDTLINSHSETYLNYSGEKFTAYEDCEAVTELAEVVEEVVYNAEDYYLDLTSADAAQTVTVTNKTETVVPAIVLAAAAAIFAALGITLIIRRMKK